MCIHTPRQYLLGGDVYRSITRIAVPVFFIISGFFLPESGRDDYLKRQIKKVMWLIFLANLLYFADSAGLSLLKWLLGKPVCWGDLLKPFTWVNIQKMIFFNESPLSAHLWYLNALLYTLIIVAVLNRFGKLELLFWAVPVLLMGDLALGKYSLVLFDRKIPYIYVRNYLFVGIPYFYIGILLQSKRKCKLHMWNQKVLGGLMVLFTCTALLERSLLISFDKNAAREHYISTTFMAVAAFLFFLNLSEQENMHPLLGKAAAIGREYSTGIYIVHPFVMSILLKGESLFKWTAFLFPVVVYFGSILFLILTRKVHAYQRSLRQKMLSSKLF